MTDRLKNLDSFLRDTGTHPDIINLKRETERFAAEMKNGLASNDATLMMLPTYVTGEGEIPDNEPVIVIDAGGTNFRVALVTFEHGKPVIDPLSVFPMPGSDFMITKDEFLQRVVHYLSPVINRSGRIGVCFAYPAEILPNRDGRLVAFNKEVRIAESEGMEICAELSRALREGGYFGEKRFVLINDTVATLLGGMAENSREYDGNIGFILGTGTNTSYIERSGNISRYDMSGQPENMIINMESGGYGLFPQGRFDTELDLKSSNYGEHLYEKMVSGAYLGPLVSLCAAGAARAGHFSDGFAAALSALGPVSAEAVDEFSRNPLGGGRLAGICKTDGDSAALYHIVDAVLERAAKLVCVNLAAVLERIDGGKSAHRPACIVAEGSTFHKSKLFFPKLQWHIRSFIRDELGRHCEFVHAASVNLVGASVAALLNLRGGAL